MNFLIASLDTQLYQHFLLKSLCLPASLWSPSLLLVHSPFFLPFLPSPISLSFSQLSSFSPFICLFAPVPSLIMIALLKVLLSSKASPSSFDILTPFYLYVNFRVSLTNSPEKPVAILIGIALSL